MTWNTLCPACGRIRDATGRCGCTSAKPEWPYDPWPEPYVDPPIVNIGWKCPVCGAGNSPDTKQCPCTHRTYTSDRTYL